MKIGDRILATLLVVVLGVTVIALVAAHRAHVAHRSLQVGPARATAR